MPPAASSSPPGAGPAPGPGSSSRSLRQQPSSLKKSSSVADIAQAQQTATYQKKGDAAAIVRSGISLADNTKLQASMEHAKKKGHYSTQASRDKWRAERERSRNPDTVEAEEAEKRRLKGRLLFLEENGFGYLRERLVMYLGGDGDYDRFPTCLFMEGKGGSGCG